MTENLYTPQEAAEYCRVDKTRILLAFKNGDLQGLRLNKRVIRFSKADLEAWLNPKASS